MVPRTQRRINMGLENGVVVRTKEKSELFQRVQSIYDGIKDPSSLMRVLTETLDMSMR